MGKLLMEDNPLTSFLEKGEFMIVLPGTLADFYKLEEIKADFIHGQIYIQPMPASRKHEKIFVKLLTKINQLIEPTQLGEVYGSRFAIAITPHYHPEPDIVFIAQGNTGHFTDVEFEGTPDLVIEITSKSTRKHDLEEKRPLYQEARIPEIIIIDEVENKIIVDVFQNGSYQTIELHQTGKYQSQVIAAFELDVEDILG
jgi:Uma2 family endonuclease